jgi:hypothetical protein
MALVWTMELPDSQKIVLLALADSANDEGHCWPSMRTLSIKCSKGERTIQGVVKDLVDGGHLTRREVPGKGCNYTVHPRRECAPAAAAPTPAEVAPHPRSGCGQSIKEPSKNPKSPAQPRGDVKTLIPADWKLPAKADLPPKARACAEQWTDASYETHGEAFHGYWRTCRRMNADWTLTWANRVVALHSQVMRDQKFGNAPTDTPKPTDPNAGKLFDQYRAGEISFDEFDRRRAAAKRTGGGRAKSIGEIANRIANA